MILKILNLLYPLSKRSLAAFPRSEYFGGIILLIDLNLSKSNNSTKKEIFYKIFSNLKTFFFNLKLQSFCFL